MARFKIDKVFKITNRGSVISGDIIDGSIGQGDIIELEAESQITKLKISSVEFIDYRKNRTAKVGLMVGDIDENTERLLAKMFGQAVMVVNIE